MKKIILALVITTSFHANGFDITWDKLNEDTLKNYPNEESLDVEIKIGDIYKKKVKEHIKHVSKSYELKIRTEDTEKLGESFLTYVRGDCAWRVQANKALQKRIASAINECIIYRVQSEINFMKSLEGKGLADWSKSVSDALKVVRPPSCN